MSKKHGYVGETMLYRAFDTSLWQMKQRKNERNMVNVKIDYQYFRKKKLIVMILFMLFADNLSTHGK